MVTPELFRARLDAAIERTRAALAELQELRAAIAGERPADELTADDERELAELAAERAARMRRARPAGGRP